MRFPSPLIRATLVRRYKRFLADCILEDGREITASVPNTGSMKGLNDPGSRVWLSFSDDPKLKYAHRLQIVEADGTMVGINTGYPNKLAEEAIRAGMIGNLANYRMLKREQRYGENSRIDLLLSDETLGSVYVEVKNVHLMREPHLAEFPDSVTSRGAKHLHELAAIVGPDTRSIMLYMIQRSDCEALALCRDVDPAYCAAFDSAMRTEVEAYAVQCQISKDWIKAHKLVPIREDIFNKKTA